MQTANFGGIRPIADRLSWSSISRPGPCLPRQPRVTFVSKQAPPMNDIASAESAESTEQKPAKKKKEEGSFVGFLIKLVIAVVLFRTLLFTSFSIPSESM